jgi:hypothetical protein
MLQRGACSSLSVYEKLNYTNNKPEIHGVKTHIIREDLGCSPGGGAGGTVVHFVH